MSNKKKIHNIYGIAGSLLILLIPYFIKINNDNANLESAQSLCPFKMLTGFPCPGCGITKSIIFLYEGNLSKSIFYHLFGPITILFCVLTVVILTIELIIKKEFSKKLIFDKKIAYFLGTTLAVYHLFRISFFVTTHNLDEILTQSIWK